MPIGPGYLWKGLSDQFNAYRDSELKRELASKQDAVDVSRHNATLWDNALGRQASSLLADKNIKGQKDVAQLYASSRERSDRFQSMYNAEVSAAKAADAEIANLSSGLNANDPAIQHSIRALRRSSAEHMARANQLASSMGVSFPAQKTGKGFFEKLDAIMAPSPAPAPAPGVRQRKSPSAINSVLRQTNQDFYEVSDGF